MSPQEIFEDEPEPLLVDVRARFQPSLQALNWAIDAFRGDGGEMLGVTQTRALIRAVKRAYEIDAERIARAFRFATVHSKPYHHQETMSCWGDQTLCNARSQARPLLDALVEDGPGENGVSNA